MSLGADKAKTIAEYALAEYDYERDATKRVIAAIPAGREQYSPDAQSRSALDLAWHIASSEAVMLDAACGRPLPAGEPGLPTHIRSAADVLAWYDQNIPAPLARARSLSGEHLDKSVDFFGVMQAPAFTYLTMMIKHSAHHRGQLAAYLRPMGAKVPSIYGPSADAH